MPHVRDAGALLFSFLEPSFLIVLLYPEQRLPQRAVAHADPDVFGFRNKINFAALRTRIDEKLVSN